MAPPRRSGTSADAARCAAARLACLLAGHPRRGLLSSVAVNGQHAVLCPRCGTVLLPHRR